MRRARSLAISFVFSMRLERKRLLRRLGYFLLSHNEKRHARSGVWKEKEILTKIIKLTCMPIYLAE